MTMTLQMPVSSDALRVVVSRSNGRTVVTLSGELDATTGPKLSQQFAELSRVGHVEVDLDLAKLESMDSSGLAVVVAEHKRALSNGGGLVILSPTRGVIRLFQTSGLMSYLVVKPKMSV
jgi:anti-sigma B factor antagonist